MPYSSCPPLSVLLNLALHFVSGYVPILFSFALIMARSKWPNFATLRLESPQWVFRDPGYLKG